MSSGDVDFVTDSVNDMEKDSLTSAVRDTRLRVSVAEIVEVCV